MKRILLLSTLILFTISLTAQKISIEDAVMLQRSELGPERMKQVQWVEDADLWSHIEDYSLKILSPQNKVLRSISLDELNALIEGELKSFPDITWLSKDVCYFSNGNQYYKLNVTNQTATKWVLKPSGKNIEFHETSGNFAFTKENNVVVSTSDRVIEITDLEEGVIAGQAIARSEFGIVKGLFWSPDGNSLAFYQKDERNVSEYPLVDYSSTPASVDLIRYPMAGGPGEFASAGVYNLKTEKTIYLSIPFKGPQDGFYITNIGWSPDNQFIYAAIIMRDQKSMQLIRFNAIDGTQNNVLFSETSTKYVEPEQPVIFAPGKSKEFLWFSERDGFNNLYKYSISGKLLGKTTVEFPINEIIGFEQKGKFAVVSAHGTNPTEQHTYKVDLSSMKVTQITKTAGSHSSKLSSSSNYLIDTWSSLSVPRKVEILTLTGETGATIQNAENPLEGRIIGETTVFSIKGEDQTDLWCRMITPPGLDESKKYPVLVYVYNGPHVQLVRNSWLAGAPLWMHSMAAEGYIIFTVDGRGSSNRGRDFEQAIYRQCGTMEMQDQESGVNYLRTLPYVDADRLAVHGWSYGGFMTTSLMLRKPGLFKVGVAGGPVIDWKYYEVMYTERYMDTPQDNMEGYEASNLKNHVANLEGDLLMIHGTVDNVVVMQHNMTFQQKCVEEGVQVDFHPYPGHPHNVRGKDRVHLITKVLNYIKEHL